MVGEAPGIGAIQVFPGVAGGECSRVSAEKIEGAGSQGGVGGELKRDARSELEPSQRDGIGGGVFEFEELGFVLQNGSRRGAVVMDFVDLKSGKLFGGRRRRGRSAQGIQVRGAKLVENNGGALWEKVWM